nr:nucleotidyltransferase domain-containing protein [Elusimicrobiota bacterium]
TYSYVWSVLNKFQDDGLLNRRNAADSSFFKANLNNEMMLKVFEMFEMERKKVFFEKNKSISRLIDKFTINILNESKKQIQLIILYGSVAREKWTKESDIDILLVSAQDDNKLTSIVKKAKEEVSSLIEISAITTDITKFSDGMKKQTEFYKSIIKDRIILYNEYLFWRIIAEGEN